MADHGPSRLLLALPALPGLPACSTAHSCVSKVHHKTPGGQRIALPQRRTDRFASPDLGFWFDEGIPYDPPYDHLQTAAIFDMCCNQSFVMSDNLASAAWGHAPAQAPSPGKLTGHTHSMAVLMSPTSLNASPRPQHLPRRASSPCGSH